METYLPGISIDAELLGLMGRDKTPIAAIAEGETLRATLTDGADTVLASGDASGTVVPGANPGDWRWPFVTPSAAGRYRVTWTVDVGGRVGKFIDEFNVRKGA